jgi:hypothetical protein
MVFSAFAVLGGVITFGSLGVLALFRPVHAALVVVSACLIVRAVWWHLRRPKPFMLDRRLIQARRKYAGSGWIGVAYFGWILGTTLFTQMVTPLVQALASLSATLGIGFGIAAGLGLGLGRSFEPWRGAMARADPDIATVVEYFVKGRSGVAFQLAAIATAAALLATDVVLAVR